MGSINDIKRLKELLDMGAITQEEFEAKKAEFLQAHENHTEPQIQIQQTQSGKSKVAAGVLALLLGTIGIHKFYLGYTSQGLIMLLVSLLTLGIGAAIMAVIALIEGILYLTKSDAEFDAVYVQGRKGWF